MTVNLTQDDAKQTCKESKASTWRFVTGIGVDGPDELPPSSRRALLSRAKWLAPFGTDLP